MSSGCRQVRAIAIDELLQHRARYVGSADASFKLRSNTRTAAHAPARRTPCAAASANPCGRCPASQAARLPRFPDRPQDTPRLSDRKPPAPRTHRAPTRQHPLGRQSAHQGAECPQQQQPARGNVLKRPPARVRAAQKRRCRRQSHKLARACNAIYRRRKRPQAAPARHASVGSSCVHRGNKLGDALRIKLRQRAPSTRERGAFPP